MSDEVILDRVGSAAVIRLNRPKALNSLNLPMVRAIREAMEQYLDDASIRAVILKGEGERGLCAGGDIRVLYDMGKRSDPEATRFWREEFPLNYAISRYPKPYVALMDGITMGGGVGLSAHGRHRIVTERTRLAMPETGIGYFPDVGATWLLPQAPGEVGTWMGLTGIEVDAAGAIYAGLADVLVPSDRLDALVEAIGALSGEADDGSVEATIARFSVPTTESALEKNRSVIDRCFGFDRVEDILEALADEGGEFAATTRDTMLKRSPTSLRLTLRLLRAGRQSSGLVECLEREFGAGVEILRNHDFYEGVRAAIIDKDRNPQWSPASLDEVRAESIGAYLGGKHGSLFPDHRL
ncbi:enoyl-CoA hydratase/isomerase family protein [Pseudorhizobium halotolerans]|uniref:3-hydroxyisobutyryl-CoA hydrolase n=1 Tax=Pseudorhizobium halotolerans TaxID=1233081 RepID=A0ABM8PI27_9HYPH|nr:enoyl-CoA hydratase/isomerase family protein [Pseudorhizobium halotolerans]CAD7031197.1 enoyl-CoA hydratase/isomerase family protein [Pseudorhizobium halotolerans]